MQEIEEDWPQARWEDTGIVGMKPEKKTEPAWVPKRPLSPDLPKGDKGNSLV